MDEQEIKAVARQAAQEAFSQSLSAFTTEVKDAAAEGVTEALERLGINPDDPTEVQRDMAFVRDWRTTTDGVKRKSLLAAVGFVVVATLGALWLGIKELFS